MLTAESHSFFRRFRWWSKYVVCYTIFLDFRRHPPWLGFKSRWLLDTPSALTLVVILPGLDSNAGCFFQIWRSRRVNHDSALDMVALCCALFLSTTEHLIWGCAIVLLLIADPKGFEIRFILAGPLPFKLRNETVRWCQDNGGKGMSKAEAQV